MFINQASFFYACKHGSLLLGVLLFNTAPLFIPILIRFFFGEKTDASTALSIAAGMVGIIIILRPSFHSIQNSVGFIGLLSGLASACSQVILQKNLKNESNISCMFWFYLISTIFSLIVVCAFILTNSDHNFLNIQHNWKTVIAIFKFIFR